MDLYKPHFQGPHTDETKQDYFDKITKLADRFNKKLQQSGSTWITGEKLTIADFLIAHILFNWVYNDHLGGGADYYTKGRQIIAERTAFAKYVDRLKEENREYLEKRGQAPI